MSFFSKIFIGMQSAKFFRETELQQIKHPTTAITDLDISDSSLAFFMGMELNMGKKFFISLNKDKDTYSKLNSINNVCRGLGSRITFAFADNDSSDLFPNGFEEFDTIDFNLIDVFVLIGPKDSESVVAQKKILRLYNNYISQRKLNKFKIDAIFYTDNVTPINTVKNIVKSNTEFKDSTVLIFIKKGLRKEIKQEASKLCEFANLCKLSKSSMVS